MLHYLQNGSGYKITLVITPRKNHGNKPEKLNVEENHSRMSYKALLLYQTNKLILGIIQQGTSEKQTNEIIKVKVHLL